MLYMKEMRAKVVAECTLKESAAINQILGRRVSWFKLDIQRLTLHWGIENKIFTVDAIIVDANFCNTALM